VEGEAEGVAKQKRGGAYQKGAGLTRKWAWPVGKVGVVYRKVGVSSGYVGGAKGEGRDLRQWPRPLPAHSAREGVRLNPRPLSIDKAHFSP